MPGSALPEPPHGFIPDCPLEAFHNVRASLLAKFFASKLAPTGDNGAQAHPASLHFQFGNGIVQGTHQGWRFMFRFDMEHPERATILCA